MNSATALLLSAAAAASSPDCSGNGFYYADVGECSCFSCFEGPACDSFNATCAVDALGGNPLLFEEFWRAHRYPVQESLAYRVSYDFDVTAVHGRELRGGQASLMPALNRTISKLHRAVGNVADLEKKNLVIGAGCTQLIDAAIYACKKQRGLDRPMYVYAQAPYYSGYPSSSVLGMDGMRPNGLSFTQRTDLPPEDVIEFVTYPNNPTNTAREPVYGGRAACTVYDSVYLWPSLWPAFTLPKTKPTVQLFSLSKMSGHAGTRFGWGLTEDAEFAGMMAESIERQTIGLSVDAQLKAYSVFEYLNRDGAQEFNGWIQRHLVKRWGVIDSIFDAASQTRFTQLADRHGFYAWVRCERPEDAMDCSAVFKRAGVAVEAGTKFGSTPAEVRLEMVQSDVVFDIIAQRVRSLVGA